MHGRFLPGGALLRTTVGAVRRSCWKLGAAGHRVQREAVAEAGAWELEMPRELVGVRSKTTPEPGRESSSRMYLHFVSPTKPRTVPAGKRKKYLKSHVCCLTAGHEG